MVRIWLSHGMSVTPKIGVDGFIVYCRRSGDPVGEELALTVYFLFQ